MEENHVSYYAIIPANVRYDEDLTPNAKLLYGEITALCNMKGYCWASNSYFASLYKVSTVSISKWVKQLVDKGYIESVMKYRDGTKEIEYRYLTIVNGGIKEKLNTPIKEKFKDNNTLSNNTNNIKDTVISKEKTDYELVVNKLKESPSIKPFKKIEGKRKSSLNARLREYKLDGVLETLEKIEKSNFLSNVKNSERHWLTIDWILNPTNFAKISEGNYDDNNSYNNNNTNSQQSASQYKPISQDDLFRDA